MTSKYMIWLAPIAITLGCASGHCRKSTPPPPPPPEEKAEERLPEVSDKARIFVYKFDGSRQCSPGTGVSVEKMQGELKNIKVFSAKKQKDGLMRTQLCGTPTGMSNVYEISAKDLPAAEKLKFMKWLY